MNKQSNHQSLLKELQISDHCSAEMGMCPSAPHTVARKVPIDMPERLYIIAPHMSICQKVFCSYARKILHDSPKVFFSFAKNKSKSNLVTCNHDFILLSYDATNSIRSFCLSC